MSESEPEPENNTEWVKQRISDEEISQTKERLDNAMKMLHQRDIVIRKMAQALEQYGINMVVLARNSQVLLDENLEFE